MSWRLFLTVWLVYSLFATTNVVRETYLAIALGADRSVRVDRFLGLHPDLFEFPGRGSYINSNPGASLVAALPYGLLVSPVISLAVRLRPGIAAPKPPAVYEDPRPNRTKFLNASRERGLDIVLGLAALGTAVTVMAPLGALAAVLMFQILRRRLGDDHQALWLALVFAFATPMIFRSAFLNQNLLVAHLTLGAFALMTTMAPRARDGRPSPAAAAGIGACMGFAIVNDYSAVPLALVFGLWILVDRWRTGGASFAVRDGAFCLGAAVVAVAPLFLYQWAAFGHPLWPAQRYMPATEYSVKGWFGFTPPDIRLMVDNIVHPGYGLLVYCPLVVCALAAPWYSRRQAAGTRREWPWVAALVGGLLVFSSMNQFSNLQWNTGVRYMMPAVPLLFILGAPVLIAMPRAWRWALIGISFLVTLAVTMTREHPLVGLRLIFTEGPTLPILRVLDQVSSGYANRDVLNVIVLAGAAIIAVSVYLLWRQAPLSRPALSTTGPHS